MKPELYLSHPDAQFWADFSFVDFSDGYLDSMSESISKALSSMNELEGGSIANPDENRMVGHYWLRDPELAPNEDLTHAIRETLAKVKEVAQAVHSGSLASPKGAFTDLLVIGIGGSALGPQFVGKALGHPTGKEPTMPTTKTSWSFKPIASRDSKATQTCSSSAKIVC